LCANTRKASFPTGRTETISVGVATYLKGDDMNNLLRRADDALYQAKNQGRDRVCLG
jgi:diguanylate cyclase (GGDEF)-like protein